MLFSVWSFRTLCNVTEPNGLVYLCFRTRMNPP